jgi:hypothetical protein
MAVNYAQQFNQDNIKYDIDMAVTPKWRRQSDIVYTGASIPADARFTDLSGTGDETISPTSPLVRNGQPWFLFYRRDIFAAANISKPETMDDVLSAASRLNGSDFNGDGKADFAVCFNPVVTCVGNYYTFLGILGPMLQTSPSAGVFFQPESMQPLVQNAAMVEALRVYKILASYNSPDFNQSCGQYAPQFAEGMSWHPLAGSSASPMMSRVAVVSNLHA